MAKTQLAPLPSLPRRGGKAAAPRACSCGCGQNTRGGMFNPGHDSRRLGWAIRMFHGLPTDGITPGETKAAQALIDAKDRDRKYPGKFEKAVEETAKDKKSA